ncbi:adenylate/guanylate cyclase domain-containing protein [Conexibacter sp. CPCC 206217]|uniref:adenylate/guanylate cyclase domain-containing protein n=1 Tax=Conexibacter sp. CPCC 206217 TaxID=3064574 RepID=UPI00271F8DC0|nr:adenylate/guanylate cyclase domain-containing protein [Conexibacter sp. CPCC 206217]MDO8209758.1 adenylate/guanylate cyclase domain-containing protein [Conexibacter sp. CPCC 206217]
MDRVLRYAYRRLGRRYPLTVVVLQFQIAHLLALGGIVLLRLYQPMSNSTFLLLLVVAELLVALDNVSSTLLARRLLRPVVAWLDGARDRAATAAAWRALASLPSAYTRRVPTVPIALVIVPFAAFATLELDLKPYSALAVLLGMLLTLLYGAVLRFFFMESLLRPVLEDVALQMPDDFDPGRAGVSLRRRLLIGLPAINILTGVIVAGIEMNRHGARLDDIGPAVVIAILVASIISVELTVLLSRSIFDPIDALRSATERVGRGDLSTRVAVVSTDETGRLARSFNDMVAGLSEREKLHEAFDAYVGPDVAEMVLRDGTHLDGKEQEVTVLSLDIRDFTQKAEKSTPRRVVDFLNEFYGLVVPIIELHGGRADKYVGDGLLAIFGTPEPLVDHADRAVASALDVAVAVRDRYDDVRVGIGVNSGPVIAGTIGGGGHVEFTVIGDAVNTAERVEQVTRQTGDTVLVTEATRRLLTRDHGRFENRPAVPLKGKTERVQLWAPKAVSATAGGSPDGTERGGPEAGGGAPEPGGSADAAERDAGVRRVGADAAPAPRT